MTRNELIGALNARVNSGDVEAITAMLRVVTFAGWQIFGYTATTATKAEYEGFGWQGFDIKVMSNFAKRTRYRTLSEKEVAYSQKVLPNYTEQIGQLLSKPGYYDKVVEAFAPYNSK